MAEKLRQYQGSVGRMHDLRNEMHEKYVYWKENKRLKIMEFFRNQFCDTNPKLSENETFEDFSHLFRRKTTSELIRISAAVMGIEFSYAAETAFVSPTLLKIGIDHKQMTLIWALSPLIGFFFTPVLGSLSDRCRLKIGRRRPFICAMSLGVLIGLILVPNGEYLGYVLGDRHSSNASVASTVRYNFEELKYFDINGTILISSNETYSTESHHPWGVIITIVGTVLLDFDADACQSPARAYLLDVTVPDDHVRGLSTFTVMAGLGGFFGYALGGINWDETILGALLGGHVRAVFAVITVLFLICVTYTITSFKEMPLYMLELNSEAKSCTIQDNIMNNVNIHDYGSMEIGEDDSNTNTKHLILEERIDNFNDMQYPTKSEVPELNSSILLYLKSIIHFPRSIKILCITNLFCWMAHVCYSLYFTDFVGEAVFAGNPMAAEDSPSRKLYESGVRFGCWGMSMYSLSCACYSITIETFINRFGVKRVYVGGLLTYSVGMCLMAVTKSKLGVIVFSWTAGVMYSTLFTMPYLIIARYHTNGIFDVDTSEDNKSITSNPVRGLGTDVAIISSMVFLAQFILSICIGSIVNATGTTTAILAVASILSLLGAVSASQIIYV